MLEAFWFRSHRKQLRSQVAQFAKTSSASPLNGSAYGIADLPSS